MTKELSELLEIKKEELGIKRTSKKRVIAYQPVFSLISNSAIAGLFLSQLDYWKDKGHKKEWIYKTLNDFQDETGLKRREQERAIKIWHSLGILDVKVEFVFNTRARHFKINYERLYCLIDDFCLKEPSRFRKIFKS